MIQVLQTRDLGVEEHDGTAPPSLDLLRVLDEVEQALAPREVLAPASYAGAYTAAICL